MKIQNLEISENSFLLLIVMVSLVAAVLMFLWLFKNVMNQLEGQQIANLLEGKNYSFLLIAVAGIILVVIVRWLAASSVGLKITTQAPEIYPIECNCIKWLSGDTTNLRCYATAADKQRAFLKLGEQHIIESKTHNDSFYFALPTVDITSKNVELLRCPIDMPSEACQNCALTIQ